MADKTLDARNLMCPMPVLKTRKAMGELARDQTLELLATDPGSVADVKAFCEASGNVLLEVSESQGVFRFVIKRAA